MASRNSIVDQLDWALKQSEPEKRFDRIREHKRKITIASRRFFIWLNAFVIHSYVRFGNFSFFSPDSKKLYECYVRDIERTDQVPNYDRNKNNQINKPNFYQAIRQKKAGFFALAQESTRNGLGEVLDVGADLELSESERLDWLKKVGAYEDGLKLKLPSNEKSLNSIAMILTFIISVRFIWSIIALSPDVEHKLVITTAARLTGTNNVITCSDSLPLHLLDNSGNEPFGCNLNERSVGKYFFEQYKGICLWNLSLGLDKHNDYWEDYFIVEKGHTIQVIGREIRMIDYIGLVIVFGAGVVHMIMVEFRSCECPAIMFLYLPKFHLFKLHVQLRNYLDLLRLSYSNFWSIYTINSSGHLSYAQTQEVDERNNVNESQIRNTKPSNGSSSGSSGSYVSRSSQTHIDHRMDPPKKRGRRTSSDPLALFDSIHLNHKQYESYMPEARGSIWRTYLAWIHPVVLLSTVFISLFIFSGFTIFLGFSLSRLADHNMQLYQSIMNPQLTKNFHPLSPKCLANYENKSVAYEKFKELNMRLLNLMLETRSITKYYNKSKIFNIFRKQSDLDENSDISSMILDAFQPRDKLNNISIIPAVVSLYLICILTGSSMVIYVLVFNDLSFWLYELRIKLSICKIIQQHYQIKTIHQSDYVLGHNSFGHRNYRALEATNKVLTITKGLEKFDSFKGRHESRTLIGPGASHTSADLLRYMNFTTDSDGEENLMNVKTFDILRYIVANQSKRDLICEMYAHKVLKKDLLGSLSPRQSSRKFLITTYLDFRLFQDEIDDCRSILSYLMGHLILQCLNVTAVTCFMTENYYKYSLLTGATMLSNVVIFLPSAFRSLCFGLSNLIYSMLAASVGGDRLSRYMFFIWRKCLTDLCGSRTKFTFRYFSIAITYATGLQVSK